MPIGTGKVHFACTITKKKMITHIYFDWSGTLARSGSKDILLSNSDLNSKLESLFPDTIDVLFELNRSGYKLGIISNSQKKD